MTGDRTCPCCGQWIYPHAWARVDGFMRGTSGVYPLTVGDCVAPLTFQEYTADPITIVKEELYLVFAGDKYYPSGGMNDFQGVFPSVEDALLWLATEGKFDWWQIVEREPWRCVRSGTSGTYTER